MAKAKKWTGAGGTKFTQKRKGSPWDVQTYASRNMNLEDTKAFNARVSALAKNLKESGKWKGASGASVYARKVLIKELKKTSGYKAFKKAKTRTKGGFDAEGNRITDRDTLAVYDDTYDTMSDASQKAWNESRKTRSARLGLDINPDSWNAADRWNSANIPSKRDDGEWWTKGSVMGAQPRQNPFGMTGNADIEKTALIRPAYQNWRKEKYDAPEPTRVANNTAQHAPPPHGALAFSTGHATAGAPTITTPKDTVKRKVVQSVSRRIKQKAANRGAGIRN